MRAAEEALMRTRWVEERIGEWVGPIDWSYDWARHAPGLNPQCIEQGREVLRRMESEPGGWRYCPSGLSTFEVVEVGMYDGWPFWVPTPAIGYIGPLGSVEVAFFYNLSSYRLARRAGAVEGE
jgi:hypothetical protein